MIRTLTQPEEIDAVFLHPGVQAYGEMPADWSGRTVLERGCRVWGFDGGAFIVQPDGRLSVAVLPDTPRARAVEAGRAALRCETAAGMPVYGVTPKSRPDALHFAVACGMRYRTETEHEWFTEPGDEYGS